MFQSAICFSIDISLFPSYMPVPQPLMMQFISTLANCSFELLNLNSKCWSELLNLNSSTDTDEIYSKVCPICFKWGIHIVSHVKNLYYLHNFFKPRTFVTILLHLLTYMETEMHRSVKKSSKIEKVRHWLLKLQELKKEGYKAALITARHYTRCIAGGKTNDSTSREIVRCSRRESHLPESPLHFSVPVTPVLLYFVPVARGWRWIQVGKKFYIWVQ